jgi:hypothetical protein
VLGFVLMGWVAVLYIGNMGLFIKMWVAGIPVSES